MTCRMRGECGDIRNMEQIGREMKATLDSRSARIKRNELMIKSLSDMLDAERDLNKSLVTIALIELAVIVVLSVCMWVGGGIG